MFLFPLRIPNPPPKPPPFESRYTKARARALSQDPGRALDPEEYVTARAAQEIARRTYGPPDLDQMLRDHEFAERLHPANLLNGLAICGIVAPAIGLIAIGALLLALVLN